jgi:hypothetical protein
VRCRSTPSERVLSGLSFLFGAEGTDRILQDILGRHCADTRLHRCLSSNKEQWKEAGFLYEWHGIKPDEMIDVLFNGKLFHSDPAKRERMRYVQTLMNDDLAHHCLVYSVYTRMLVVRNINWIVQPLEQRNQYVRIPAEYVQSGSGGCLAKLIKGSTLECRPTPGDRRLGFEVSRSKGQNT